MIRVATYGDIDSILSIVRSAQLSLKELDIDQWQDGYPSREVIEEDIKRDVGYVLCDKHNVAIAYAAIVLDGEPAYSQINAKEWHTESRYVVVHRLCVAATARRQGAAIRMMQHAMHLAKEAGICAFRIDTHEGNIRMLAMLCKMGFERCGVIYYDSGKRIAFDLNFD